MLKLDRNVGLPGATLLGILLIGVLGHHFPAGKELVLYVSQFLICTFLVYQTLRGILIPDKDISRLLALSLVCLTFGDAAYYINHYFLEAPYASASMLCLSIIPYFASYCLASAMFLRLLFNGSGPAFLRTKIFWLTTCLFWFFTLKYIGLPLVDKVMSQGVDIMAVIHAIKLAGVLLLGPLALFGVFSAQDLRWSFVALGFFGFTTLEWGINAELLAYGRLRFSLYDLAWLHSVLMIATGLLLGGQLSSQIERLDLRRLSHSIRFYPTVLVSIPSLLLPFVLKTELQSVVVTITAYYFLLFLAVVMTGVLLSWIDQLSHILGGLSQKKVDQDNLADHRLPLEFQGIVLHELGARAGAQARAELAEQVAHDIRSPLAVLEAASAEMSGVPEEQRIMIRRAATHVQDIANSLLSRYAGPSSPERRDGTALDAVAKPVMLSALVEAIVSEKRLQYRSRSGIVIDSSLDAESFISFAALNATEFKRLVSNLINNAVEALPSVGGTVNIDLSSREGHALLAVRDNGTGIEPELLARLGSRGATQGKAGGSGLGLAHAKTCAANWGGHLELESRVGHGTTVTILVPLTPTPAWFVSEVSVRAGAVVVVLDDDTSIHQLWRHRLESAASASSPLELVHAFTPADLQNFASNSDEARRACYLLDYHLVGHSENGLDLADALGITAQSILVTSAYDDPRVIDRCEALRMRLLPKSLAGLVPFRVNAEDAAASELVDAVLIDDDELVRTLWAGDALSHGKSLKVFSRPADFLAVCHTIDKRSPIYIDHMLGENVRGELIARDLRAIGFTTVYLATGQSPEAFGRMPWITKIVGKSSPWRTEHSADAVTPA